MALNRGILLDTHTFIWLQGRILTVKADVLAALRSASEEDNWFVSSFTFYEVAYAVGRKRLHLDRNLVEWFRAATSPPSPRIIEITPELAAATTHLPESFHGDPGDRIMAATAILHGLTLCTHDKALLRHSRQGLFRALRVDEIKEP